MARATPGRRRPSVNISLGRASRLYRLVTLLAASPRDRETLLSELGVGLRTFYRELDLLRRCAVKIQRQDRAYSLKTTPEEAQGRLPFPDPQLSFAEMTELSAGNGPAGQRLNRLLDSVIKPLPTKKSSKKQG
jgi:hypothetical protein